MLMSFGADYYDVAFEMTSQAGGVLRTALDAVSHTVELPTSSRLMHSSLWSTNSLSVGDRV
jgi:hypothetical protein